MTVRGYLMGLPADPQTAPISNTYRWATVTDNSPLEIQLDGDSLPLATIPDCLCDPLTLANGDRVWTQIYGRKVVVHGAQGGGTGPHTLPNEVVVRLLPSGSGTTNSGAYTAWPAAHGGPLSATLVKRVAPSLVVVGLSISSGTDVVGVYNFGVKIDGGATTGIMTTGWNLTGNAHVNWTHWRAISGLSAASHTFVLQVQSLDGSTMLYNEADTFSMTLREVAP